MPFNCKLRPEKCSLPLPLLPLQPLPNRLCSAVAHPSERIACDAKSALGPLQKRAPSVAASQERLASDMLSALRPSSSALTNSQERIASDAQSALWSLLPRSTQFNTRMLSWDRWRQSSLGQRHHLPAHRSHKRSCGFCSGVQAPTYR